MDSLFEGRQVLQRLDEILTEWKNLTVAEHEKIAANDWSGLEGLHSRKSKLQQLIEKLEAAFSSDPNISNETKAKEKKRLKLVASDLLALEKRNEAILSERIAEADRQLKNSNKTIQSLRHVQKAYGNNKLSFWQAYS